MFPSSGGTNTRLGQCGVFTGPPCRRQHLICVCVCVCSTFVSSPSLFLFFLECFADINFQMKCVFCWRLVEEHHHRLVFTARPQPEPTPLGISLCSCCVLEVCVLEVCVCNIRLWHLSWWLYENVPLCLVSWFSKHSYWWTCITGASAV